MSQPFLLARDEVSFTLGWDIPSSDGGCPILGYALYRDDGAGGTITTSLDGGALATSYNVFEYAVTLGAGFTGATLRVKVEALTVAYSVESPAL